MKLHIVIRREPSNPDDLPGIEVQAFSKREDAETYIVQQAGKNWEMGGHFAIRTVSLDEFVNYRTKRYWWCRITVASGREVQSGVRKYYDFVPQDKTHSVHHQRNSIEVRSFISAQHALDICRAEAAAAKMQ